MKITTLTLVLAAFTLSPLAVADDKPAPAKCEMMKKPSAAQVDASERQKELEQLVSEMNSNVGPKKIEAMAAILTRLVEQSKAPTAGTHDHTEAKEPGKDEKPHH